MDKPKSISRRTWLKKTARIAVTAVLYSSVDWSVAAATETTKKATKASVHYQGHPNDGKMCEMCKYFIPPGGAAGHGMMRGMMGSGMMRDGTCQVVQGRISPMGYCTLYTPV